MYLQHKDKGFTLIEMLIVVALIAILAAIAMPAYNGYVSRGKIKTAQADLVALGLNIENEYRKKLSYASANTNYTSTNDLIGKFTSWRPASSTTDFVFTASLTSSTYTVTATGQAGGVNSCAISLNNVGTKSIASCAYSSGGTWL